MNSNESLPAEEIDVQRGRRTLLALFAVALVPVLAAMLMYFAGVGIPEGRTNQGELLDPPLTGKTEAWVIAGDDADLPWGPESGWKLIVTDRNPCLEACREVLSRVRQTRIALGRETARVQVYYLEPDGPKDADLRGWAEKQFAGLRFLRCRQPGAADCALPLSPDAETQVFLADPLGNVILRYHRRQEPRALLDDLKRLLKVSRIG